MNFIGWIRDLFGIQKDMYETKKTRLEIEKIEEEKREKLITPATIEDVKLYDPKTRRLMKKIAILAVGISVGVVAYWGLKKAAPEVVHRIKEEVNRLISR